MTKLISKIQEMKLKMASVPLNLFIGGTIIILIIHQFNSPLSETILSILVTGAISIVSMLLSNKESTEVHDKVINTESQYDNLFKKPTDISVIIKKEDDNR